jgi:hypothetical protein
MEYSTSILVPSKWNMLCTKAGCSCSFRVHVELITKSKPTEGKANSSDRRLLDVNIWIYEGVSNTEMDKTT